MNILITGASGFIGFHLANDLSKKNKQIYLTDNFYRGSNDNEFKKLIKKKNVHFFKADLTQSNQFKKIPKKIDFIYHLAAINGTKYFYDKPDAVLKINTLINLNLLDYLKKNQHIKTIFASSSEVYASTTEILKNKIPSKENIEISISNISNVRYSYAISKIFGENAFYSYAKIYGLKFAIVRFHNIFGPRMGYDHVIPELFLKITKENSKLILNGYQNTRSFCYVSDAVEGLKLVSKYVNNSIYNIGNDKNETKIKVLAQKMLEISNKKLKLILKASPVGSVRRRLPNINKIRKIGYIPKVNLNDGLEKTIKWYEKKLSNKQK